jgi:hypothetical protein
LPHAVGLSADFAHPWLQTVTPMGEESASGKVHISGGPKHVYTQSEAAETIDSLQSSYL